MNDYTISQNVGFPNFHVVLDKSNLRLDENSGIVCWNIEDVFSALSGYTLLYCRENKNRVLNVVQLDLEERLVA
jgi:hypothetical protein